MAIRVAINGFGRIGRALLRAGWERSDIEFVHVNDLTSKEMLTHLLKHDTIHGPWKHDVKVVENGFSADGRTVPISAEPDPSKLPWKGHRRRPRVHGSVHEAGPGRAAPRRGARA
jgi:glyceraldehyde 3-phosphate dehydrogenase